jgi:hypothetical protein
MHVPGDLHRRHIKTDRLSGFVWALAAALLAAFFVFTIGVNNFSDMDVQFFLMALLVVGFVLFTLVLARVRGGEPLHPDRAATIGEPGPAHFLFHDLRSSPLWLVARLYVGFAWLEGGSIRCRTRSGATATVRPSSATGRAR